MTNGYSRLSVISGWLVTAGYFGHSIVNITMPRSPKISALRDDLRNWHYLLGSILLVLVIVRLVAWAKDRGVAPPAGLSPAAFTWGRTLALASYILLLLAPFLGILYGWSDGFPLKLFGVPIPALMGEDRAVWMFTGYFHSGMGFILLVLNVATILTLAYITLRFGRGLLTALPPGYGAFSFIGLSVTVYAFATFRSPEPGPHAVAIFWAICAAVAIAGWLIHRNRTPKERTAAPGWAKIMAPVGVAIIVALGAYGPHALFRVTPWPMTAVVEGAQRERVMQVAIPVETEYERTIGQETYKWCRFCHTVKKGEKALVGPNLYAIWGQRAGTAPGFAYSAAMMKARDRGLVWNDQTISDYIANPDGFMPGTSMIISSGPVSDAKKRQATINILKRETMGPQADVASPGGH